MICIRDTRKVQVEAPAEHKTKIPSISCALELERCDIDELRGTTKDTVDMLIMFFVSLIDLSFLQVLFLFIWHLHAESREGLCLVLPSITTQGALHFCPSSGAGDPDFCNHDRP